MNKLLLSSLFLIGGTSVFATGPDTTPSEISPDSPYTVLEKENASLLSKLLKSNNNDALNIRLHTKASFSGAQTDGIWNDPGFRLDQLRIELRGSFDNAIFYRFQQRLTNYPEPYSSYIDNLPMKIDYAGIGYRFNSKWKVFAGKMCTAYGGFEFDDNPINVYQYNTVTENMPAFLTGIDFAYNPVEKHEIRFQVLESRNGSHEQLYGKVDPSVKFSKADYVYTVNWNGKLGANDIISTRWSGSYINQAKDKNFYLACLGTALNTGKFGAFLDLIYSKEGIDRSQIISRIVADDTEGTTQMNTSYTSAILGLNYRFADKWNLFAKGMYDTANKDKTSGNVAKGKYSETFSYSGGIEYYPFKNESLHINLAYIGRSHNFTSIAKQFGSKNYNENKIELSLIYALNIW